MRTRRPFSLEKLEDRAVPAAAFLNPGASLPDPTAPRQSAALVQHQHVELPNVGPNPSLTVAPSNDPETLFVQKLYYDLLGRSIDPGAQPFIDHLNMGHLPRREVVKAILESDEYASRRIEFLFQHHLGRAVDEPSLKGFVEGVRDGGSLEEVEKTILGSQEYRQKHGDGANFIRSLYLHVLEREPDQVSLNQYTQRLSGGEVDAILQEILSSPEARGVQAANAVETLLNQKPTASLGANNVTAAKGGAEIDSVIGDIAASDAYFNLNTIS